MKSILFLTFCGPIFLHAQPVKPHVKTLDSVTHNIRDQAHGIKWVDNLSWQQIMKKAKKENKYIFVDCYATWCGPCKKMDKDVYTNDSVGTLLNAKFISVKVQMDSTKFDNEFTRVRYKTAREMENKYGVSSFPSYLFFSPSGDIVYKDIGYKAPDKFLQVARDALNPSKQYFVLLNNYNKGKKDYVIMPDLINTAKRLSDKYTYYNLLKDYYAYLYSLEKEKLYSKENIEFIASTIDSSSQLLFQLFYPDGSEVDKVMNKSGYAKEIVDQIIWKEKVNPFLKAAEDRSNPNSSIEPDWNVLYNSVTKDYAGDFADRNVLDAKMRWHGFHGNVLKCVTLLNDKIEKYGTDTTDLGQDFILNNQAWTLWAKFEDTIQLNRMINWMEGVVRRGEKATGVYVQYWPTYLDTYANLLHKTGKTSEAIKWQELAIATGRERNIGESVLKFLELSLDKMKKGEPTWLPDGN